jgi:hypothetical protein
MTDIVFGRNKDFENDNGGNNSSDKANVVKTLPAVVTICLAPCNLCSGEYVDITHSFRLRCLCPCHGLEG